MSSAIKSITLPDVKPGLTGPALDEHTRETLRSIEGDVLTNVTLGDVIRLGSQFTTKREGGFVQGNEHCALAAGALAARALGFGSNGS